MRDQDSDYGTLGHHPDLCEPNAQFAVGMAVRTGSCQILVDKSMAESLQSPALRH